MATDLKFAVSHSHLQSILDFISKSTSLPPGWNVGKTVMLLQGLSSYEPIAQDRVETPTTEIEEQNFDK